MDWYDLNDPVIQMAREGKPVWGTCAGMILMAKEVDPDTRAKTQPLLQLMDITVRRNAFGSQLDSFEADLEMPDVSPDPMPTVFIRAPIVSDVGPDVQVLGRLSDGTIVAVRQGNLVATAFHPELTGDPRLHQWFLSLVEESVRQPQPVE
jgi:pyridoxal 5'-phosphate synthase pdxT subunit